MNKKKVLSLLIIPFFAFLLFSTEVKAGDPITDIDDGFGSGGEGCSAKATDNTTCRATSGKQCLYASLTNDARSDNHQWEYCVDGSNSETVAALNQKHDDITMNRTTMCAFLAEMGIQCDVPKEQLNQILCNRTEYIYFAITAPYYHRGKRYSQYTVKEVARKFLAGSLPLNGFNVAKMSNYFNVHVANTGVYSVASITTNNLSTIADITSGYGVAAVKLSDFDLCTPEPPDPPQPNICSGYSVTQTGSLNQCSDSNYNVISTFRDMVDYSKTGTGSENGVKEYDIGGTDGYCSLYCLETRATANLPGGFANALTLGSSIVWPTSENTFTAKYGNMYPLTYSGTRKCVVQVAPNLTYGRMCQVDPVDDYKDQGKLLDAKYKDNVNASGTATNANKYVKDGITKLSNPGRLGWNNEIIRRQSTLCTTPAGDDKPTDSSPASNCADAAFWDYYKGTVSNNISIAEAKYNEELRKWLAAHPDYDASEVEVCDRYTTGSNGKQMCIKTHTEYECNSGGHVSGKRCVFTESDAQQEDPVKWWHEAKNAWNDLKNKINEKYNKFTAYVDQYRETVNVYLKVKLCSDYSKEEMSCSGSTCTYYNFSTDASLRYEYEDNQYVNIGKLEIEQGVNYTCDNCGKELAPMYKKIQLYSSYDFLMKNASSSHLQNMIDKIEATPITMHSGEVKYALPSSIENRYINKKTLEVTDSMPSNANYILLSFRNLPTSFDNKVGRKYNLILSDIKLGHNGVMNSGNTALSWVTDYVCHYEVTTTGAACECPPGTKNAGVDLYQAVLDNGISCAEAKSRYCEADNVPECTTNCVYQKYCPSDLTINITGCVNSGTSLMECINALCNGNSVYRCPSGTLQAGMDITNCVTVRMANGNSEANAKRYCENIVCNLDEIAVEREVDKRNPFPSIDADATTLSSWPNIGVFNLTIHGRVPGFNWNSPSEVSKRIFKNRGVNGDEIYNLKPLYHFELDTATILRIREYNEKQALNDDGYNDFTLSCVKDASNTYVGTACFSSFVHNPNYGGDTTGTKSTCGNARSYQSLVTCLNR